jgi:hypothetical protein
VLKHLNRPELQPLFGKRGFDQGERQPFQYGHFHQIVRGGWERKENPGGDQIAAAKTYSREHREAPCERSPLATHARK